MAGEDEGMPEAVDKSIFDRRSLAEWADAYPYRYAEAGLSAEELIAATAMLGVPSLPESAIIVSGDLSRMPPNMLTIDGALVGASRSLATVPSLSWLRSSISAARQGDGSAAAWIPIAAGTYYMDPLSLLAGDLEQVLTDRSIALHTHASTPSALGSADLVIVGAHGGLAEHNGFFRGLSDDTQEPLDFAHLVDAVRNSRVALLFVCSGGRFDRHPESGALAGLAHKLLDLGLDAVVAPSWPIPFTVARPWLDAFLRSWNDGSPIMECYRAGNDTVARETSHDFSRSLAMALYGNPYITR
ncbi:CHAT domain-containing protein [Rhizobium sp. 18055]|uniref:CHAT domain-containing protein n=1 Tax=Rhizobium sp. 18055 TaxID=2681403 RepID=UPI00135CAC7D|nr:CHAT domain-containing protein [Rhizobium sp. 18055]